MTGGLERCASSSSARTRPESSASTLPRSRSSSGFISSGEPALGCATWKMSNASLGLADARARVDLCRDHAEAPGGQRRRQIGEQTGPVVARDHDLECAVRPAGARRAESERHLPPFYEARMSADTLDAVREQIALRHLRDELFEARALAIVRDVGHAPRDARARGAPARHRHGLRCGPRPPATARRACARSRPSSPTDCWSTRSRT